MSTALSGQNINSNIKLLVWRNAEYLAGYEQQDAHEFLIAALDMIHGKLIGSEETKKTIIDQVYFHHIFISGDRRILKFFLTTQEVLK